VSDWVWRVGLGLAPPYKCDGYAAQELAGVSGWRFLLVTFLAAVATSLGRCVMFGWNEEDK
jgi:hypothetical protein